jgi:hypothetical protein
MTWSSPFFLSYSTLKVFPDVNLQMILDLPSGPVHFRYFLCLAPIGGHRRFPSKGQKRMTFCLGINLSDGLVGIADTRALSGNEMVVGRKLSVITASTNDVLDDRGPEILA